MAWKYEGSRMQDEGERLDAESPAPMGATRRKHLLEWRPAHGNRLRLWARMASMAARSQRRGLKSTRNRCADGIDCSLNRGQHITHEGLRKTAMDCHLLPTEDLQPAYPAESARSGRRG
jgi:hypothetical protein